MSVQSRPTTSQAWLVGLLMVTFAIGTDDFVVAGALPAVAGGLGVRESTAGQLVTAFSLTYAAAAPVMAGLTAALPPRRLLLGGLAVFAGLNLLTAAAPSFAALVGLRVVTAIVAASVSPAAFAAAGRHAAPERRGRAIGIVAAGLTVSLAVGVPLGTWLSTVVGWRATFVAVAFFTVLAIGVVLASLPHLPASGGSSALKDRLRAVRSPAVLTCAVGTTIGACAGLLPYTYIAPTTASLDGEPGALTASIATVGIVGAVGTAVGGRLADAWGADRTMLASFALVVVATGAMAILDLRFAPVPVAVVLGLLAVYAVAAWGNNAPMNARTMALAGPAATEAIALNTSGLYVGVALGAAVGGISLDTTGVSGLLLTATATGCVGLAVMLIGVRRWPTGAAGAGS